MNTASLIHYFLAILTVILASMFVLITTSDTTPAPSSFVPGGCADSVISFSPCLPYISAPPNDLSDEPSSQCCDIFTGSFDSGEAKCLCYLVRQSTLLGFPLNASKLLSLSDLCSVQNNSLGFQANSSTISLESLCSGSPTLPPLISTPNTPHSGSRAPPPPSTITMPSSANSSSGQEQPTSMPSTSQQRNNGNHLVLPNSLFLIFVSCFSFGNFKILYSS